MAKKTVTRKKVVYENTVAGSEWHIIEAYTYKSQSVQNLSDLMSINPSSLRKFIDSILKDLKTVHETNLLISDQSRDMLGGTGGSNKTWRALQGMKTDVNKKFLGCLSMPNDPVLSEQEMQFCYMMVYEGQAADALADSGLAIGLKKTSRTTAYKRAVEIRVAMLKSKPNVQEYIRDLQNKYVADLDVSRESIQAEIMRTITQLRNSDATKNAPTIAKLLNDLGRTKGIFVDKVESSEISLEDSFSRMLEMRKERGVEVQPVLFDSDNKLIEANGRAETWSHSSSESQE